MPLTKGYIQVYTGEGKGKTTAALGQAMRALGHGLCVFMIQFMKGGLEYGEIELSRRLSPQFLIKQMGRESFVDRKNPALQDIDMAERALDLAREKIMDEKTDVLILDEINVALDFKLINLKDVLEMLNTKLSTMEVILTGRSAPKEIIDRADLVTEMKEIKHYYRQGVDARQGIES
jgi:cob(I)alamin adenosyltransferase